MGTLIDWNFPFVCLGTHQRCTFPNLIPTCLYFIYIDNYAVIQAFSSNFPRLKRSLTDNAFLGILIVPSQEPSASLVLVIIIKSSLFPLSWLRDSDKKMAMTKYLYLVPWEHSRILLLKVKEDVRITLQVTCCFFTEAIYLDVKCHKSRLFGKKKQKSKMTDPR